MDALIKWWHPTLDITISCQLPLNTCMILIPCQLSSDTFTRLWHLKHISNGHWRYYRLVQTDWVMNLFNHINTSLKPDVIIIFMLEQHSFYKLLCYESINHLQTGSLTLFSISGTPGYGPPGPPMPRAILPRERGTAERLLEMLVGDGPQNRYALICAECQSHNGMALREEFEYISKFHWIDSNFFFRI